MSKLGSVVCVSLALMIISVVLFKMGLEECEKCKIISENVIKIKNTLYPCLKVDTICYNKTLNRTLNKTFLCTIKDNKIKPCNHIDSIVMLTFGSISFIGMIVLTCYAIKLCNENR